MRPEERDAAYLWDMLDAARRAADFTRDATLEVYLEDAMRRMAVERALEVLGEAARRVSDGFRAAHPEILWREIVGQRNVLAHDYGEIEDERVWTTAIRDVPALIAVLEELLRKTHE